ncbi:MAG: carboxypeptidase-like regulatory domain-containing protein, partial [Saprospiraceae bacterium]|nr:carboxypeptidase-like regulatory domain-containing protein [Saprospiraceae bacterium]
MYFSRWIGGPALCVLLFAFLTAPVLSAQVTIEGTVLDKDDNSPLIGATVAIAGTTSGAVTDASGRFTLQTDAEPPLRIVVSYLGYVAFDTRIAGSMGDLVIRLNRDVHVLREVEVVVSRIPVSILESPWSAEVLTPGDIEKVPAPDFYDGIGNLKGVAMHTSSIAFPAVMTRGFGKPNNRRFVQLIDGMDNSAPLLNFSVGNVVGISELDLLSAELVPGTASALYGPNAFNGILMMRSKNPFDFQGLSAQIKGGIMSSDGLDGGEPLYQASIRYAKSILNDRLAFKVNASYGRSSDWRADDYAGSVISANNPEPVLPGAPNFDGMNLYGDETPIQVPMAFIAPLFPDSLQPFVAQLPDLDLRRTGIPEHQLLDNQRAESLKLDGAIHYRLTDNLEASYTYRFGRGSAVYQGGERYALRDFTFDMQKIELIGEHLTMRAYLTHTDDGDSYNLTALGGFANEAFKPSQQWVGEYAVPYVITLLSGGTLEAAHAAGRATADAGIPQAGSPEFVATTDAVRRGLFQSASPGAGFVDDSKLYHVEATYNFADVTSGLDLMIGGNFRKYDLFSDGTVFNEDPMGEGSNERIGNREFGVFLQAHRRLAGDRLRLTGSVRYDKNENFEGQLSPRLAAVYLAGPERQHAFRASFQTGFRNPSNQEQFIYFPLPSGTLLGGTEQNAGSYGVYNGGAYSNASYLQFLGSQNPGDL